MDIDSGDALRSLRWIVLVLFLIVRALVHDRYFSGFGQALVLCMPVLLIIGGLAGIILQGDDRTTAIVSVIGIALGFFWLQRDIKAVRREKK